jgi:hypothetical protein
MSQQTICASIDYVVEVLNKVKHQLSNEIVSTKKQPIHLKNLTNKQILQFISSKQRPVHWSEIANHFMIDKPESLQTRLHILYKTNRVNRKRGWYTCTDSTQQTNIKYNHIDRSKVHKTLLQIGPCHYKEFAEHVNITNSQAYQILYSTENVILIGSSVFEAV